MELCLGGIPSAGHVLEAEIGVAAEAGFNCLDLWLPTLEAYLTDYPLAALDACLREHGVYAVAVSGLELLSPRSRVELLTIEAHFLELCTRLDALGGGVIVVHPGARADWEIGEQASAVQAVHALRSFSDLAAPFDVNVAFGFRGNVYSAARSPTYSQETVRRVARANVGLALSTLDFCLSGGRPEDVDDLDVGGLWLVYLTDAMQISHGALSDTQRTLLGHGLVPVRSICERLAAKGFRGPYSVEVPSPKRPLLEAAPSVRQAALDILSPLYS